MSTVNVFNLSPNKTVLLNKQGIRICSGKTAEVEDDNEVKFKVKKGILIYKKIIKNKTEKPKGGSK